MKKNYTLILISSLLFSGTSAQWVQTNGPEGMYVTSFHNVNDSVLLCGTQSKGVYRSTDNGNTWSSTAGLDNKEIDCFEQDSLYVYAGCFGEGVFRSSDNGYTWVASNNTIQTTAITCMLKAGNYIFAASINDGMFRSADHGNTWVDVSQGLLTLSYIPTMTYSGNRLMVEVDNYIFFSNNFGNSWNVDQGTTAFYTIDNFFVHGDTVLASDGGVIFRSTNHGLNWSNPYLSGHNLVGFDNIGDTIYAGAYDGVLMSTDYGLTWSFTGSTDLRVYGARFLDDFKISGNNFLLGYQEIGVYTSQNKGVSWNQIPLSNFAVASTIDDAMIFDNGTVYTGTHTNGVYKTTDQGNTWTKIGTLNPTDTLSNEVIFDMLHVGPDIILAGGCGTGLYRSADNGVTWNHITNGLPPDNGNFTCIQTLAQSGSNVLCAMINGVFYSLDSGVTWLPTSLTGNNILSTGGFAVRGNIVCVGVTTNPTLPKTGIYRSTDYGLTWNFAEGLLDIEVAAAGGNSTMYCGELFSAYVSHNDGLNWVGLGLGGAFSILAWDSYAFIGNNDGVFFSDDYGASFTLMNQGMDPFPNNAVQGFTRDSQYVYAGTYRDGVWRRPLGDFGITTSITKINPDDHNLSLFPDPASDFVNITVPEGLIDFKLTIINSAGSVIISQQLKYTRYQQHNKVYVKNYPDGIYTVFLENNSKCLTGKFIKTR
jgi:photosystem II stability/assembly factor-like uncharacterized protein